MTLLPETVPFLAELMEGELYLEAETRVTGAAVMEVSTGYLLNFFTVGVFFILRTAGPPCRHHVNTM